MYKKSHAPFTEATLDEAKIGCAHIPGAAPSHPMVYTAPHKFH